MKDVIVMNAIVLKATLKWMAKLAAISMSAISILTSVEEELV